MPKLGVNIDHVATVREARGIIYPDPAQAAIFCEEAGCDSIVCHLREDRRHIKDADVWRLRKIISTRFNLEMSIAEDIVKIACTVKPAQATLVPEKRKELTTEGGLDVAGSSNRIARVVKKLKENGIEVSLFIDPRKDQIAASKDTGARVIELHTGEYADSDSASEAAKELKNISRAAEYALSLGLEVNAGHGLNYANVQDVARIEGMNELNIGHSIISRALMVGLKQAVFEMLELIR